MMQTTEDRDANDSDSFLRPRWRQVSCAVGRLHPQATMRPAMIVGQVVAENPFRMRLVLDDDVVEAVPAEGADDSLAEGICLGRARRCGEEPGAESTDTAAEVGAVDGVSVVDEKARDVLAIAGGLGDALRCPAGVWMRGDTGVDDPAAAEREHDEDVEEVESCGDEDEEVAGPCLVQVVADERGPALPMFPVEAGGAVLGDGARRDLVAELGQMGGDDL